MPHKKNKFLTFICSLLPGAGEMYLGFMKQGICLMSLFFGIIAFCVFLGFEAGLFTLPIVWFYSFFHVNNLNGLPDEEFRQVEDDYLFHFQELENQFHLSRKKELIIAYGCIIIGICALWNVSMDVLYEALIPWDHFEIYYSISRIVPQSVISLILIILGVRLIRGKKAQLEQEEEEENMFSRKIFGDDSREDYFPDKKESDDTNMN